MESKLQQLTALTAPHAVASTQQVAGLTRRLQALHAAKLLSDRELRAVEDCVADLLEAKASFDVLGRAMGRAVSAEVASSHRAVAKAHVCAYTVYADASERRPAGRRNVRAAVPAQVRMNHRCIPRHSHDFAYCTPVAMPRGGRTHAPSWRAAFSCACRVAIVAVMVAFAEFVARFVVSCCARHDQFQACRKAR